MNYPAEFENTTQVTITGMGVISSIGTQLLDFKESLKNGICGIKKTTNSLLSVAATLQNFSFLEELTRLKEESPNLDEMLCKRAKKIGRRSTLSIQTSILSTLQAWNQAQLAKNTLDPKRIGVVVAGQNLNTNYSFGLFDKFKEEPTYLPPPYAIQFMDTNQIGSLSELFQITGEGFTTGGASASGNVGLIQGFRQIQTGISDVCLVVGALTELSEMEIQAFQSIGALGGNQFKDKPEKACRPFDQAHEGFIYGQGAGCLILESSQSAKKREIPILGKMLGGSIQLAANRMTEPGLNTEISVMKQTLKNADVKPAEIQYINAHGTSTPLGDKVELAAIEEVFRSSLSQLKINSTKSLMGHCLNAAGVIEAIAVLLQMKENFIHPNLNLENSIETPCKLVGNRYESKEFHFALSNSFGFGGINTSILLKKGI